MSDRTGRCCVLALAAALLASAICFFPVSDAYESEDGDSALSFRTSSPLSSADAERLFSDYSAFKDAFLESLSVDTTLNVTSVAVSDLTVERSIFNRVDGTEVDRGSSERYSMDISVTAEGDGRIFDFVNSDLIDLLNHFNYNTIVPGDVLVISGHLEFSTADGSEIGYVKNAGGSFVRTSIHTTQVLRAESEDVKMKLTHGPDSVKEVSLEGRYIEIINTDTESIAQGCDAEDADAGTKMFNRRDLGSCYLLRSLVYSGDADGSYKDEMDSREYEDTFDYMFGDTYGPSFILSANLSAVPVSCYGAGVYSLFTDVGDPSLESDSALRAFLQTKGDLSDSYSDAEDLFDSVSSIPKVSSFRRLMVIGSIGVLLSVAALAILFYLSRRK